MSAAEPARSAPEPSPLGRQTLADLSALMERGLALLHARQERMALLGAPAAHDAQPAGPDARQRDQMAAHK